MDFSWTLVLLICVLVAGLVYFARNVGLNLSATSVLFQLMFLFHGPAYIYYTRVWGPDTAFFHDILSAAPKTDVVGRLDLALAIVFAGLCLGMAGANMVAGCSRHAFRNALDRWGAMPAIAGIVVRQRVALAGALGIVALAAMVVADGQIAKVLDYFTSDLSEFGKIELRREGGGGSFYIYNLLLAGVIPFIAFCLVTLRRSAKLLAVAIGLPFVGLVLLGKAAMLSKAPLAVFALQLVVVWILATSIRLSGRKMLLFSLVGLTLFIGMTFVALPNVESAMAVLEFLFYRVFMVVNEGLVEYFAAIPSVIPHNWGAQFSWIAGILQENPSIPNYIQVAEVHRGLTGSTTTVMFMGDAWADFAWPGVVIASLACGAIVRAIDISLIVRRGKSVGSIAGLGLAHYGLFIALSTSLQTALLTGGLFLVIPLVRLFEGPQKARNAPASPAAPLGSPSIASP